MRMRGWQFSGARPEDAKFVAIGAPHTSNWDFVLFLAVVSHFHLRAKAIGKHSLVRWPFGKLMRRLGIIPIERDSGQGLVEQMVDEFSATESMALVIAPEGTRKPTEYWRSGFYRIAVAAQVPIVLTYIDGENKVAGIGPTLHPTGDIDTDMEIVREFFTPICGLRPENQGPIRLRPEGG
ncbi:MAG: glycerol acyltransferase [bacterium]|nr:glycerol acyltransferase [bacterium]